MITLEQLRTADPASMANDLAFVVEAMIRTAREAVESTAKGSGGASAGRVLALAEVLTQLLGEGCELLEEDVSKFAHIQSSADQPKAGAGTRESPLRALYHLWQASKDAYNAVSDDDDGSVAGAIFTVMTDIEAQAAAFEPETTEDLAFKIIFADDDGDMSMNCHQRTLARGAYAVVGIEPCGGKVMAAEQG